MPFHLAREMKNAQTAGKIESPTTISWRSQSKR